MATPKYNTRYNTRKLDPTKSPRSMYGAELRFKREQAGLSQEALGAKLFLSAVTIAHLETGLRRMQPDYAEQLDQVLNSDGFFVRNLKAGRATPYREHFADTAELETLALTIREWEPLLVPGLIQTPAYATAVIRGYDPVVGEETVTDRLAARLIRAEIFNNPDRPMYWAVVDEAAIRRTSGGPAVMAEQLRHVAAMVRRKRIIFQVLPFSSGAHAGTEGALKLMTFEEEAPLAYVQAQETGTLLDDPATIKRCALTYDLLAAAALSPEASLSLIETAAEEYERGSQEQPKGGELA
jgi:transcriptional regulator with XRE-family HTH domain